MSMGGNGYGAEHSRGRRRRLLLLLAVALAPAAAATDATSETGRESYLLLSQAKPNITQVLRRDRERAEELWHRGRGLLWFQHFRRAGGTSLCHLLQEGVPRAKFLTLKGEACQPEDWKLRDALAICEQNVSLLEAELRVLRGNAFAQEYGPMPGPELLGHREQRRRMEDWVFVLSLRDPWERFFSQMRYEMAVCLTSLKALTLCVGGKFERLGNWWSPTSHPDSILGVPEAAISPGPELYVDNYYTRILLNRTDASTGPLEDADLEAAKAILVHRVSVVIIAEDFAHSALVLACTLGMDFDLAKPLLFNRVRPYEAQRKMIADIPGDLEEMVERDAKALGKEGAERMARSARSFFARRNSHDFHLYHFARKLSRRRVAECGRRSPRAEELRRAPPAVQYKQEKQEEAVAPELSIDDLFGCVGGSMDFQNGTYVLKCPRTVSQATNSWWSAKLLDGQPKRKLGQPPPGEECWASGFSWQVCCAKDHGPTGNKKCWDGEYNYQRCCVYD